MTEKLVRSIKKEVAGATNARKRTFLFKCLRWSILGNRIGCNMVFFCETLPCCPRNCLIFRQFLATNLGERGDLRLSPYGGRELGGDYAGLSMGSRSGCLPRWMCVCRRFPARAWRKRCGDINTPGGLPGSPARVEEDRLRTLLIREINWLPRARERG